ncbi:MAG: response regulator [Bacteroidales bacterium]|nr:response regulator [Bacteroidota bacterium]MBL6949074.1 response regulator [Bacteroidales bacterium]
MKKVLIIDDDKVFRTSLTKMLVKAGYATVTASEGEEGLTLFKEGAIDLVITDIIMPRMEGIETIVELRKLQSDLKIIAISGGGKLPPEKHLQNAKALKVNAVLKKPFSFKQLEAILSTL